MWSLMIQPAVFPSSVSSGFVYAVDRLRDLSGETDRVSVFNGYTIANAVKQPGNPGLVRGKA